jgi:Flp pilus assembly pilin Flp
MKRKLLPGQSLLEYALLIALLAIIIILVVAIYGNIVTNRFSAVNSALSSTPQGRTNQQILADFQSRILAYYTAHGSWPRTFSPYNFTDVGLNPTDWSQPVNGLYWSTHGSEVGISNKAGDNLQVYVKDLNGNTLHLFDGWAIWCPVNAATCYYHTVAPGNEVDISTVYVTGQ